MTVCEKCNKKTHRRHAVLVGYAGINKDIPVRKKMCFHCKKKHGIIHPTT